MYQDNREYPCNIPPCDCKPDVNYPENPDWLWFFTKFQEIINNLDKQTIDKLVEDVAMLQSDTEGLIQVQTDYVRKDRQLPFNEGKEHLSVEINRDNGQLFAALPGKFPKPYELPQATSTTLGGVKADPAAENQTIPVGIQDDGKLVVAPSGGGSYVLPQATSTTLGGVKADPALPGQTIPVGLDADGKMVVFPAGEGSQEVQVTDTPPTMPSVLLYVNPDEEAPIISQSCFATCAAEAAPQQTTPVTWYVPKTMPRPSGNPGMMVDVFWQNGRADGLGYDVSLVWGSEGGMDNETIVSKISVADALTGEYSIPAEGTVRYLLEEIDGRQHWRYVSGDVIGKQFSSATSAEIADKAVPGMEIAYLPGIEIFLQLDKGNTAELMNIVPAEGATLPVYGNGTGAKTGAIPAGYVLHLVNSGDHWQILNGGNPDAVSGKEAIEAFCPEFNKTGSVITCQPATIGNYAYPLSVKSQIVPRQEGSGEPSPENVRPIVATDTAELTRCGSNLVKEVYLSSASNNYGLLIRLNAGASTPVFVPAGSVLSVNLKANADTTAYWNNSSGIFEPIINTVNVKTGNHRYKIRTIKDMTIYTSKMDIMNKDKSNDNVLITPTDFMISINDGAYAPYTGTTFTAQLPPDTVALDWTKWQNQTSDGVWHDMAGVKPDIQPLPGVNNLYSDTGDTTVSGREVPYADHANLQAQIDELRKAIISQGGNV